MPSYSGRTCYVSILVSPSLPSSLYADNLLLVFSVSILVFPFPQPFTGRVFFFFFFFLLLLGGGGWGFFGAPYETPFS